MTIARGLPLLAASILSLAALLDGRAQTTESLPANAWPLADVEVTDSPLVTAGHLENGLRYVIRPHIAPDKQLSLRLLVRAGSLDENDDERGFAHFVEHMAFNGTKHFPAGELIRVLQRQGAQYGPHINATTSHLSTLYKLDLPESAPDSLETGLRVFRDYADGILFESTEVKRERGVILSEARTTNTPQLEESLAFTRFLYGDTRIPSRSPIGVAAQIAHADRTALRRFYDAWYRPENLTVIVVGNVSAPDVRALLEKHFASLQPRGPARPRTVLPKIHPIGSPTAHVHPRPLLGANINLISITDRSPGRPTWSDLARTARVRIGLAMIEERLRKISRTPASIINSPSLSTDVDFLRFRRTSLTLATSPASLPAALAMLEQEVRRALELGFTAEELAREQDIFRRNYRTIAASVATAPSSVLASALIEYVEDDAPLRLIDELRDNLIDIIDQLTPEGCQQELRKVLEQPPRIFVSCHSIHTPPPEDILAAYRSSRDAPLAQSGPATADAEFAYQDFGLPGSIAEKTNIDDLGICQLLLANGVRVNLKPTAFQAGTVHFLLRAGYGRLNEPADKPGLALWFPFLWEGGTGKHSVAEISRIVGGLTGMTTSTLDDACVLKGTLPSANLPLALHELTALVGDSAFRDEGWESTRRILRSFTGPLWNQPEGAVSQFVLPLLAGGDPRIGIPGDSKYMARTADEFRAWFAPQLASGPLEFSLVGDFDLEKTIDEITRTLGTLPERESREAQSFPVALNFHGDRRVARYYFNGTADRACRWEFFWRINEPLASRERRQVELLASIFEERVRNEVRERKGSSYRVEGGVQWSDTYPGFSFIRCSVDHKPADREAHTRAVRKLALAIADKGITADELTRFKAQALAALLRARSDNGYWIENVLADSQKRPFRLEAARSAENDLTSTTVADINALAARYFGPDRVFHYLIEPSGLMQKKK